LLSFRNLLEDCPDVLAELPVIYGRMDAAYDRVAEAHGFHCSGCEDNCCLTRFFHHTLVEYLYLMKGFDGITPSLQSQLIQQAVRVNAQVDAAVSMGEVSRVMCPANSDGLCILYDFRPMICRLHGISHQFRHPSGKIISGPGCAAFESRHDPTVGVLLDRTPFYRDMAMLEGRVREKIGIQKKIKMTVAQMLTSGGEILP
jgi:Fe-S-cluster containining protein